MLTFSTHAAAQHEQELRGRTVVVLGRGAEIARRARAEGADVITATFDADDWAALERFFAGLPGPLDQVVVTAGGPHPLAVARTAVAKMRPGGTLVLTDRVDPRLTAALTVALAPVRIRVVAPDDADGGRELLARAA